jgi:hypothetical protein
MGTTPQIGGVFRHVIGNTGTAHAAQKLTPHSRDFQPAAGFHVPFENGWVDVGQVWAHQEGRIEKMGLLNFLGENE